MLLKSLIVNFSFGRAGVNTLQRAYLSLKKMFEIKWKLYVLKVNAKPRISFADSGRAYSSFAPLNDDRR